MTVFAILAVLSTFAAVGLVAWPLLRAGSSPHPVSATLTALLMPAAVLVAYLFVSNYDWRPEIEAAPPMATGGPGSVEEAVASLENRLAATPEDEEGWILLGSSYLSLSRPVDAGNAYRKALELSGGRSVEARLGIAESKIVLDPGSLAGPLGDEIEAVLEAEPRNPKALWYGGLLGLARGQPEMARERWQALLAMQPPEQIRQIIENQLAELGADDGQMAATPPAAGTGSIGISVTVSDAVRNQVSASAPLFVFVRDASTGGPPIAVIRRAASELPVTLNISDADLMIPGRSLASLEAATVVARVANGGDPVAKPGDVYGEASWQRNQGTESPLAIVIDQVVNP